MTTWLYRGEEVGDDVLDKYIGFVYRITNLKTNRQYIGKKLFKKTRTKTIKGRRRKVKSESDWRSYYGSNKVLIEDVKNLGEQNFKREILKFCTSKGTANYYELKYQIDENALESENYYNEWIIAKIHRSHIKKD